MLKPSFLKISLCSLLLMASVPAFAAPKSEPWPMWDKSNESNVATFDHQKWQRVLDALVVKDQGQNLVDYAGASKEEKETLQKYIRELTAKDPRAYNKKEQFAYWVNLYNALTVNLILNEYPLSSITKLGGFFSFGPWNDKITLVAGEKLTLNDIEHRILRPIWKDSRIHYAVNCASLGCPDLLDKAFSAQNTQALLDSAAIQFTNSKKGAYIEGETLTLSSIYEWYGVDFGKDEQKILAQIDSYRKGQKLEGWTGKIKYDYNWNLNQSKPR